jgi:hypothetical protein
LQIPQQPSARSVWPQQSQRLFSANAQSFDVAAGSLSYTDIGRASTTSIDVSYGRYLTPHHKVGVNVTFMDTDGDA